MPYSVNYNILVGMPAVGINFQYQCPDGQATATGGDPNGSYTWHLIDRATGNQTISSNWGLVKLFHNLTGSYNICVEYSNACGTSNTACLYNIACTGTGGHSIAPPVLTVQHDTLFTDSLPLKDKDFKEFTIYPNPASDHLVVNLGTTGKSSLAGIRGISIYNGLGVLVDARKYPDMPRTVNFALKNLVQGIYLLKVEDGKTEKSKTLYIGK